MSISSSIPASESPEPPWRRPEFLGRAPTEGYGYLSEGVLRTCSLDELRQVVARGPEERVHFVWGPGLGRCVPTAELPEVFEALRASQLARLDEFLRSKLTWAAVVGAGVFLWGERILGMPLSWLAMMWAAFFLLPIVDGLLRRQEWRQAEPGDAPALGEASRYFHWLAWQRTSRTTHVIIGLLVATWLLSETAGSRWAIKQFAMDTAGVQAGAWWKPLTCFFLHGGPIHLVFNALALSRLGQWVEAMTEAAWVPLILFLATLGGSLAGYVLPPDVPSVGASGGVLGLLGFLIVFCRYPGRSTPAAFLRLLWQWVGYVVVLGLIGWQVIDNAGHLGGLLTGAMLGALANAGLPPGHPPARARWVAAFGWPAAAVLGVTALWMLWAFWQRKP